MKSIWKYTLTPGKCTLQIPKDATILCVHEQHGKGQLWALVDVDGPCVDYTFFTYPTGAQVPDNPGTYIGTIFFNNGALIFHVFFCG